MKLITFGLGGAKAIFLRLGFGASAVATQARVDGGVLKGQFKPAILRHPILLDLVVRSRVSLQLSLHGRSQVTRCSISRLALQAATDSASTFAASSSSRASLRVATRSTSSAARAHRGRIALFGIPSSAQNVVIASTSRIRRQAKTQSRSSFSGATHSRLALVQTTRSRVERVVSAKHVGKVGIRVRVRARVNYSTLAARIEASDRRDLDLIALLAA